MTCALGVGCSPAVRDDLDAAPPVDASVDAAPPTPPPGLTRWLVGDPADVVSTPVAGLILMGGGTDVDGAFAWQRDRIDGGDVVVLRASGADGYNAYLYDEIGGVDSVETLVIDRRDLAEAPYVRWQLDRAEAIFIAGGDQAVYLDTWQGTPVMAALDAAWARGAVIGGTSAGCAILGGFVYSARNGTVYSDEALDDPYNTYMTLEREVLTFPPLARVITDTHFAARDRMGRLLAFVARLMTDGWSQAPLGLGIDEATALVIDHTGAGTVLGDGAVYVLAPAAAPTVCTAGQPLSWPGVALHELRAGDALVLPGGMTPVPSTQLACSGGTLTPAMPY